MLFFSQSPTPTLVYLGRHSNRTVFWCGYDVRSSQTYKVLGGVFQAALGMSEDQISGWETEQPGGQGAGAQWAKRTPGSNPQIVERVGFPDDP